MLNMFLAKENFPAPSINLLRINNFYVLSIQETTPGISDEEVLKIATDYNYDYNYIILTFDKDYGELIFRYKPANPPAVVFFREKGQSPLSASEILISLLTSGSVHLENAFTVIEGQSIRQRYYKR